METSIPECLKERYQFQNVLGQGGTSVVYLVFDKVLQRKRAVKIVDKTRIPTSMTGQKEWSMFQKLCHPGLAELYDVVEDDSEICFVMEYIEGKTLQQMLSSGYRFSEEEAVQIGIQIIQILTYLHSRNPQVIYRDLKPSNLMIWNCQRVVSAEGGGYCVLGNCRLCGTRAADRTWADRSGHRYI